MSTRVLNFIHKVATRCTHLTGSHWGYEWWITDEQKAETGWDNHANTNWDDLEDGVGWDSHAAEEGDFGAATVKTRAMFRLETRRTHPQRLP